jgi:hypothetical protein
LILVGDANDPVRPVSALRLQPHHVAGETDRLGARRSAVGQIKAVDVVKNAAIRLSVDFLD